VGRLAVQNRVEAIVRTHLTLSVSMLLAATAMVSGCKKGSDDTGEDTGSNTAPDCAFLLPEANSYAQDGSDVLMSGTASDEQTDAGELSVVLFSDLDGELSSVSADGGFWEYTTNDLTVGTHQLRVEVTDAAGATCTDGTLYSVGQPPTVEIVVPGDGEIVGDHLPVAFEAVVGDLEDASSALSLSWEHETAGVFDQEPADGGGVAVAELADLDVGDHGVALTVTNSKGFYSVATVEFVVNGSPGAPVVEITPTLPTSDDELKATIVEASVDPEGDEVVYTYAWYLDGELTAYDSDNIPLSQTEQNQVWEVEVTPHDPYSSGSPGWDDAVIDNSPPSIAEVSVTPEDPDASDEISCSYTGYSDPDLDPSESWYSWELNSVAVTGNDPVFPDPGERVGHRDQQRARDHGRRPGTGPRVRRRHAELHPDRR
jgi:hypothetical protein